MDDVCSVSLHSRYWTVELRKLLWNWLTFGTIHPNSGNVYNANNARRSFTFTSFALSIILRKATQVLDSCTPSVKSAIIYLEIHKMSPKWLMATSMQMEIINLTITWHLKLQSLQCHEVKRTTVISTDGQVHQQDRIMTSHYFLLFVFLKDMCEPISKLVKLMQNSCDFRNIWNKMTGIMRPVK